MSRKCVLFQKAELSSPPLRVLQLTALAKPAVRYVVASRSHTAVNDSAYSAGRRGGGAARPVVRRHSHGPSASASAQGESANTSSNGSQSMLPWSTFFFNDCASMCSRACSTPVSSSAGCAHTPSSAEAAATLSAVCSTAETCSHFAFQRSAPVHTGSPVLMLWNTPGATGRAYHAGAIGRAYHVPEPCSCWRKSTMSTTRATASCHGEASPCQLSGSTRSSGPNSTPPHTSA